MSLIIVILQSSDQRSRRSRLLEIFRRKKLISIEISFLLILITFELFNVKIISQK